MADHISPPGNLHPVVPAVPSRTVDLRGERCPYTFIKARLAMEELRAGDVLKVLLDFPPAWTRVPASFSVLGHALLSSEPEGEGCRGLLFRCGEAAGVDFVPRAAEAAGKRQ